MKKTSDIIEELMEKKGIFYNLVQTYQDISKAVAYTK